MRVVPSKATVYVQKNTLRNLNAYRLTTPSDDIKKTFNVLISSGSASVFQFLRDHFYRPRKCLQETALFNWHPGFQFPGGVEEFRREFRLYHGIEPYDLAERVEPADARLRCTGCGQRPRDDAGTMNPPYTPARC